MAHEGKDRGMAQRAAAELAVPEQIREGPHYHPDVDILERADELVVRADLPGTGAQGVDVRLDNGVLTIAGRLKDRGRERRDYLFQEYGTGDFYRAFAVGEGVDAGAISAEYADGVLTLRLPKSEAARPRRIDVKTKK